MPSLLLILSACSSNPVNIAPLPPVKYEVLGKAKGEGCGSLGFLATAYYFVPMGINGRVEKAYQAALDSVPGATSLVNVEIDEIWAWWVIGTMRCTTITGDAIKEIK
ncbi:MAG TPA: hypothetical protein VLC92_05530 [Rhodocyclaceae bacterium]|nr:hypothetical protein [Rhodocyclaceae bacterium]